MICHRRPDKEEKEEEESSFSLENRQLSGFFKTFFTSSSDQLLDLERRKREIEGDVKKLKHHSLNHCRTKAVLNANMP